MGGGSAGDVPDVHFRPAPPRSLETGGNTRRSRLRSTGASARIPGPGGRTGHARSAPPLAEGPGGDGALALRRPDARRIWDPRLGTLRPGTARGLALVLGPDIRSLEADALESASPGG